MPRSIPTARLRLRLFVGKVRRQFLIVFRPGYVRRQLARRQGGCLQCAACCNFAYPCPLLRPGNRCATYHTCRPRVCGLFPINQADLDDVAACGQTCGYRFD